jgi:hypothetical protein
MVGVTSQFSQLIEPYLRFLGFVEVASRRVITQKGLEYLTAHGKEARQ